MTHRLVNSLSELINFYPGSTLPAPKESEKEGKAKIIPLAVAKDNWKLFLSASVLVFLSLFLIYFLFIYSVF